MWVKELEGFHYCLGEQFPFRKHLGEILVVERFAFDEFGRHVQEEVSRPDEEVFRVLEGFPERYRRFLRDYQHYGNQQERYGKDCQDVTSDNSGADGEFSHVI